MGAVRDRCVATTTGVSGTTVEAWGQGFMAGGLVVLMLLTVASLRRRALLHKLILLELILAIFRGTYIFFSGPQAGYHFVQPPQFHQLDQDQTIFGKDWEMGLSWNAHSRMAVLDR